MTRPRPTPETKVIIFFRCTAVALGLLFAWTARHSSNPDGICYLDLSDAFRSGQWKNAVNAVWCPLYPALLGFAAFLLKPSAYWEFPMVHLVNFGVYLCALMSFEFLLAELRERRRRLAPVWSQDGAVALAPPEWLALCYMAFLYGVLSLIQLITVTPDLCVAAAVFLAAGLVVRIQNGDIRARTFALLGLVLALGYFSKSVMFALGFVFLAVAALVARPRRQALPSIFCGVMVFLLTMSLFIVPLYRIKHRSIFGDAGRLRYAWQNFPSLLDFPTIPEGIPGHGIPTHPCQILVRDPKIYGFGSHAAGTYSLAFDIAYWYEGLEYRVEPWKRIPILVKSLRVYADVFQVELSLLVGLIFLYGLKGRKSNWLAGAASQAALILLSLTGLALFGLMLAEGRYAGPYVVLLVVGIVSGVRLPAGGGPDPWVRGLVLVMLLGPAVNLLHGAGSAVKVEWRVRHGLETPQCLLHWQVAQALKQAGLKEGDPVASLGESFGAFWARLARVPIVAESSEPEPFWKAKPAAQSRALRALKEAGVRAVVGQRKPPWHPLSGWRQVGHSDYFFYFFEDNKG